MDEAVWRLSAKAASIRGGDGRHSPDSGGLRGQTGRFGERMP